MSRDQILRSLDQCAKSLDKTQSNALLFATIARQEGAGNQFDLSEAMDHFVQTRIQWGSRFRPHGPCIGHFSPFMTTVFVRDNVSLPDATAAMATFDAIADRVGRAVIALPNGVLRRLGLEDDVHRDWDGDWIRVLLHLAWHFPADFGGGAICRGRLLKNGEHDFWSSEIMLQMHSCTLTVDRFPGIIFSVFPKSIDLLTATGWAIDLIIRAMQESAPQPLNAELQQRFVRLHQNFQLIGNNSFFNNGPDSPFAINARILRLDSSFICPPATEWGGYEPSGSRMHVHHMLSMHNEQAECFIISRSVHQHFAELAEEAGSLLPAWASVPYAPLLADADGWIRRLERRREVAATEWRFEGSDKTIPASEVAQRVWSDLRPSPSSYRWVTDQRGNIERWVGFVFHTLMECEPDSIEIRIVPSQHAHAHGEFNAILSLKKMNIYQAFARAIELAEMLPVSSSKNHEADSQQLMTSGAISIRAGDGGHGAPGGSVILRAGDGGSVGSGGNLILQVADGHSSAAQTAATGDDHYSNILRVMDATGRSMEGHIGSYADKGEEALRDHFITVLKTHYPNSTGETINRKGKTDIFVIHEARNILVAECKIWSGPKNYLDAIDQLFGYLTFRDTRTAIMLFVKNKEISAVLSTISKKTSEHAYFDQALAKKDEAWFPFVFRHPNDSNVKIQVAVLVFHFPD